MNTTIFNENLNSFAIKLINSSFDNYDDNYDFTSRSNYFKNKNNNFSKLCVETEDNNDLNNFIYDVLVISKLYAIIYNLYVNKNTDDKSFENFIKNVKIKLITSSENTLITSQIISENIVQIVDLFNINNLKLNSNITKNNYHTLYNIKDFTADIYKKNIINNIPIPLYHKFNKHEDNFTPFIGLSNFVIDSNINKITVTNESIYTYEITNTGSVNINIKFHNTDGYLTNNEIKKLYETYKNNILTSKNIDTYKYTRILLYIDAFNNILNTNYKSILSTLKYYMYYYNAVIYNINIQYLILKNQNDRIIKINKTELIYNINITINKEGYNIIKINDTIDKYNIINNDGYNINYKSEIIDRYKSNIKSSINTYITDNKSFISNNNKLNKLKCYMPTIIVDESSLKTISLNKLNTLIAAIHTDENLANYFNWGTNLNNLISYYETYLIKVYSYKNSKISVNTSKPDSIFNCNDIINTILSNFITNDKIDIIKNLNFDTDKDIDKKSVTSFVNSLNKDIRDIIINNSKIITATDTQENYPNIFNKFIDNLYISYCILQIKYSNDYYIKNYNDNYNYIDGLYTNIDTIIEFIKNNLNMLLNVNIPTFNTGITTFKNFLLNKIDELYIDIIKDIKNVINIYLDSNFKSKLNDIIIDIIPVNIDTAKINNEINDSINNYNTIINTTNDIISTISKFDNSFKDKYARFKDNDNYYYEDQKKLNTTINNYNEELKKYTDMLWYYRKNVIFGFLLIMVIILIFNINVNDNIKIIIYICILLILFLVYYLNTIIVEEKFTVCLNKNEVDTGTFKPDISYNNYYVILKQYLYYIDYLSGIKYKDDVYKNTKINDYILQLTIHRQKEQEIYKLKNINLENAIEVYKKTINIYYLYNTSIIFNIIILIISIILYILFPNIKKFIIITIVVFIIISIYYIQFNIHKRTRMNENKYYWSYLNPSKMTLHSIL